MKDDWKGPAAMLGLYGCILLVGIVINLTIVAGACLIVKWVFF